ncbi:MAG: DegT/DnrJ/EryC1/StrS family aminotransferase, partial [Bdellovibrionales bacterium]|nr:DegT/DnrJ/EryC1/StrS family aminotransferase [Bdellovibrionales bacterium]
EQPAYREISVVHDIKQATQAAQEVVSLPLYPDMSSDVQHKIIDAVSLALSK